MYKTALFLCVTALGLPTLAHALHTETMPSAHKDSFSKENNWGATHETPPFGGGAPTNEAPKTILVPKAGDKSGMAWEWVAPKGEQKGFWNPLIP